MKCKFAYIILLILLIIISASQIYATEEVTITYPEQGEHYNNITFFNGNITAGEYPIVVGSNVEYRLNCTDTNNSYYYQSSGDLWLENLGDEWNSVDYEGILQYENTTWTATENQIPPEFIDGSCILTMRVKPDGGDYFYSDNITFIFDPNPPEITYSSPENDTWTNNDTPSFTFTAIDEFSSTMSCELIIEGEGFGVNSSVSNNTLTTITANHSVMEEMEGINNAWIIECADQAGNIEAPNEWRIHFDQTAPSINLNSPDNNLNTSNSLITFNWTVTDNMWTIEGNVSDENLTTMLSCNLNINNVINATLSGNESNVINYSSNISHSVSFDDGTYYWNVTCTDNATNSKTSDTHSFTIDSVNPIIIPTHPINDQFINTLDINFSVNSTGSELKRVLMILNGTESSYRPSNELYDITCNQVDSSDLYNCNTTTSLSDGTYQANITAWDNMDNNITYSLNFTIDTISPTVNIINSSFSTTDLTPEITFNYTDAVATADCSLYFNHVSAANNATVENNTNSILTASTQVTDTNYTVYVNCTDTAGNIGQSDTIYVNIDTTASTVTRVNSTKDDGSYKAGDQINISVIFNEIINVAGGTPTLELELGSTDRNASYSTGTGTTTLNFTYTIQASDTSSDLAYTGTTALKANGSTIQDTAGNTATLTLATVGATNSLSNNKALIIDTTASTVTRVNSTKDDGSYKEGVEINITVIFDESVTVIGTPLIELELGDTDRNATYLTGTGTTTLVFNYTIQAEDTSSDLDYTGTTALTVGTSIKDAAGNDATLTLATPGVANSLGANKALVIDTTAPTISDMNASTTSSTYTITGTANGTGSSIVNITFDESLLTINNSELVDFSVQKSLSVGTNTYDINVTDAAGNSYNTTVTITRTSTGGSSYNSNSNEITTTSYWNATYSVEDNNFKTGYTKSLAQRKRLKISVENETHYVGIVNLTNTTVTINVSSDTQQKIFNIGNIYKFDVTNDNYYDIEVKLNNILDNKANITITSIHEEIIVEEVNETTINNQENQTINITNTTIIPEDANNTKEDNISTIPAKEKTVKENLYFFG